MVKKYELNQEALEQAKKDFERYPDKSISTFVFYYYNHLNKIEVFMLLNEADEYKKYLEQNV